MKGGGGGRGTGVCDSVVELQRVKIGTALCGRATDVDWVRPLSELSAHVPSLHEPVISVDDTTSARMYYKLCETRDTIVRRRCRHTGP